MAIRTDVFYMDWTSSPRVIWIRDTFTEASAQDLYDTCRHYESISSGMDEPSLCNAGGHEPIGPGVKVGITVSLFNAVYAFEDRTGPDWVICNMAGGNVVAFTDSTRVTELYPRKATAFVSADRTASSSATTREQAAIEYASFGGGVNYDADNGYPGIGQHGSHNIGTPAAPSSDIFDSRTIATAWGFNIGFINGNMTIPLYELDGITPFAMSRFKLYGAGKDRSTFFIPDAAEVSETSYFDAKVTGYLDGRNTLVDCFIENLHYIKGYIELCVLSGIGEITLGGTDTASFLGCFSGKGLPVINLGGSGQSLVVEDHSGSLRLINKTGSESVTIGIKAGTIVVDMTTVTNGTINVSGTGFMEDENGNAIKSGSYGDLVVVNRLSNALNTAITVWNGLDLVKP